MLEPTLSDKNKALVTRLFEEVWNKGKSSLIDEICHVEFVAHYPPPIDFGKGIAGLKNVLMQMRTAFSHYHAKIEDIIVEGDKVVVRFNVTGLHEEPLAGVPATGGEVDYDEIAIFRLVDGKIIEQHGMPDMVTLLGQIGVL